MHSVTSDISHVDSSSYHIKVSCSPRTAFPSSTTHASQCQQLCENEIKRQERNVRKLVVKPIRRMSSA